MNFSLNPYIAIPIAVVALGAAALIWYALVRPVPEATATGVITDRIFQEARTVEKSVPRTFRSPEHLPQKTKYHLPDRYVYEIRLDEGGPEVRHAMPAVPGQELEIGQHVEIVYLERSLPLIWRKRYVKELEVLTDNHR